MARAASAIGMAQPTLSQQVRALEADLGSVLFDRTARGMELTAAGRLLLPHAQRLITQAEVARIALTELDEGIGGIVRIGVIHTYNTAFLPNVIGAFTRLHPSVHLLVEEATALEIERRLISGHYDVGLAFAPPQTADIGILELFDEQLVLVVSRRSVMASKRKVQLQQVSGLRLALLTKNFATRRIIDDAARSVSVVLDIRIEMNSIEALLTLAQQDVAATILADKSLIGRPGLAIIPIERPSIKRGAALLWDVHRYQTKAARAFMGLARELLLRTADQRRRRGHQQGSL